MAGVRRVFNVQNPLEYAAGGYGRAAQAYSAAIRGKNTEAQIAAAYAPQEKSIGGGIMAAGGGAATAAGMASALNSAGAATMAATVGGPVGLGIAAGVGALAYFLS